jgi:NADH-quinone oxidoreductase subunit J
MNVLAGIAGVLALVSAIGVVSFRSTIYCALSLVTNMVFLAVLFLLLNAQFLAAVQIIIYAGAVMVLFVFIIALLSPGAEDTPRLDLRFLVGLVGVFYVTLQLFFLVGNGITYDKTATACDTQQQAQQKQCSPAPLRGAQAGQASNGQSLSYYPDDVNTAGNVQVVGGQLFTTFLVPFEITSLLLFVAAIGAVYLTRHHVTGSRRT